MGQFDKRSTSEINDDEFGLLTDGAGGAQYNSLLPLWARKTHQNTNKT